MKLAHVTLTKGTIWTLASFGGGQLIRLSTNVILTRLLAPQLFGIMVIVNALKTGVELVSDVGIGQSIVYNKNADDPDFCNTAWTLRSIRGLLLWGVVCAAAAPIAHFYENPTLLLILPIASFVLVISGFSSINQYLIQRKLQIAKLTAYEIISGAFWAVGQVTLAYFIPTIWALVFGLLFGSAIEMIGSYFLLPEVRHRFKISKSYTWQILHFGKWIFLSSTVYFLSISFDRFYLAGVMPLALLGVYGISRSISEMLSMLVVRLGNVVIFPFIASHSHLPPAVLRDQLVSIRLTFLLIAAFGFSFSAATVDLAIKIVFDQRYHAAGWMVPVLIIGSWISILCSLNESTLLGLGKPIYGAIANSVKLGWLLIALPVSFIQFGVGGSIVVIAVSDTWRYLPILIGQNRMSFAFGVQDLLMTLLVFGLVGIFETLRWLVGLGTSFESLPIDAVPSIGELLSWLKLWLR
jgi:O-antigen/teichoic acid export membrane protein